LSDDTFLWLAAATMWPGGRYIVSFVATKQTQSFFFDPVSLLAFIPAVFFFVFIWQDPDIKPFVV